MPIIGFNYGNYDINLCKNYGLINYLIVEKRDNKKDCDEYDECKQQEYDFTEIEDESSIQFIAKK